MKYYTPLMVIVWLALAVLCILTKENDRFSKRRKNTLYFTYLFVALAGLAEWVGIQISGNTNISPWILRVVKLIDYILTPACGVAIILQFQSKSIWRKIAFVVLGVNILFQIISFFTGWMVIVNEDNTYVHGPVYYFYIAEYLLITALAIIEFMNYGRRFRKQNVISLYASLLFVIAGVMMQEILGKEVRLAYLSLTICLALLFIHNSEFALLQSDDKIYEQKIRISEDPLTGLYSRYAYTQHLQDLSELEALPENLVVFSIDINGLKYVNDNFGHSAGDELIRGAANCIYNVLSRYGKCFRTGGDEFIVFTNMDDDMILDAVEALKQGALKWHGKEAEFLSLSVGYAKASENLDVPVEKLISLADEKMYKDKDEYYKNNNIERRKN